MDNRPESDALSWGGILLIVGVVGLNTAVMLHEQGALLGGSQRVWPWVVTYGYHIGLGLVTICALVGHHRYWRRDVSRE